MRVRKGEKGDNVCVCAREKERKETVFVCVRRPADDERHLALFQLAYRDVQRVRLVASHLHLPGSNAFQLGGYEDVQRAMRMFRL